MQFLCHVHGSAVSQPFSTQVFRSKLYRRVAYAPRSGRGIPRSGKEVCQNLRTVASLKSFNVGNCSKVELLSEQKRKEIRESKKQGFRASGIGEVGVDEVQPRSVFEGDG